MLATPTSFPHSGSYALYALGERLLLARIIGAGRDGRVSISLPAITTAGGQRTVELDELIDGTPLSDAEFADMQALEKRLAGASDRNTPAYRRWAALSQRYAHAVTLAELMARARISPIMAAA